MKKLMVLAAAAALVAQGANAQPVLGGGWLYDQVDAAGGASEASPETYLLLAPAIYRVTDAFIVGDVYTVSDNGVPIMVTAFHGAQPALTPVGDPAGESAWESGSYTTGEVILPAGLNVLTINGDGAGGIPAGFYERIDTVPDAGSAFGLFGMALAGLGLARRRFSR